MSVRKQFVVAASCMALCWAALAGTLAQAEAAVYVVDATAPGAADANPGSEEQPLKTVQHAADVAKPGDTIYVMAGRYNERIKVRTGGTEGQPINFQAMPRRSATVYGFDLDASYVRVEGFEVTADKPATAIQLRASHCEILDNYIHDMMVGGQRDLRQAGPGWRHSRLLGGSPQPHRLQQGLPQRVRLHPGRERLAGGEQRGPPPLHVLSGQPQRRLRLHPFLRQGLRRAVQLLPWHRHVGDQGRPRGLHSDVHEQRGDGAGPALRVQHMFRLGPGGMVESAPHIGSVRNWTWRRNIYSSKLPTYAGAGGWTSSRRPT